MEMDTARMHPLESVRYIVIHTEGAPGGVHGTAESINRYHRGKPPKGRGWAGIGYHCVIERDGAVREGRPLNFTGAGVEGFNAHSLHICCTGNGDLAPFNPDQMRSLLTVVGQWMRMFRVPADHVLGHRECYRFPGVPNTVKTCPGRLVDMDAIRAGLAEPAPAPLRLVEEPEVEVPAVTASVVSASQLVDDLGPIVAGTIRIPAVIPRNPEIPMQRPVTVVPKPKTSSRTLWLNGVTAAASVIVMAGDQLDVLKSAGLHLPDNIAPVVTLVLGVANVVLRLRTGQPLEGTKAAREAGAG